MKTRSHHLLPMNSRLSKFCLVLTGLAVALVGSARAADLPDNPQSSPDSAQRPDILFIAVDDLKPLMNCYGDTKAVTPNFDRLAKRGTLFQHAYCQQAVCAPSRVSLLTGLYPDVTQVYDLKTEFRSILPDAVTIPQHFRQNGYTSLGMGKIFDPRSAGGRKKMDEASWSEPFMHPASISDRSLGYLNPEVVQKIAQLKEQGISGHDKLLNQLGKPPTDIADVPDNAYTDGALTDRAINLLKKMARSRNDGDDSSPLFLAVGFKKPHLPFNAPKQYWDLYDPDQLELAEFQEMPADAPKIGFQDSWELRNYDMPKDGPFPESTQRHLKHGYYACVSYIDAQIGKLLDTLDQTGLAENTVIVLWGDHGWHLGDHGMWCKHTNFEQATRVPLMICPPNGKRGNNASSPVEFVDIFPTLCELAGIQPPAGLQGQSLVSVMNNPRSRVREDALSQYPRRVPGGHGMGYTIRNDRFRYIQWVRAAGDNQPGTGETVGEELYDYQNDPLETRSLVDDQDFLDVLEQMRVQLEKRRLDSARSSKASVETNADVNDSETSVVATPVATVVSSKTSGIKDTVQRLDEFVLHSNLWGARSMENPPEFTFEMSDSSDSAQSPSYQWQIDQPLDRPIFPYLGYGDRLWKPSVQSTTMRLPVRVGDLSRCDLTYDLKIDSEALRRSKGNLALDVWLGKNASDNASDMRTEIMLWFDRQDQMPIGANNPQGTFEFGGASWDLHIGELGDTGTQVCTIIAQQPTYSGTVDFMVPLNIVRDKGLIDEDWFLGAFELGNEIYRGSGSTTFDQFMIDVRTTDYPESNIIQSWSFDDQRFGKRYFDGQQAAADAMANEEDTSQRTVVVRFRPEELEDRQILYKEGDRKHGMSIVIEDHTLWFTHWGFDQNEKLVRSVIRHRLTGKQQKVSPKRKPASASSDEYLTAVLTVDASSESMHAYLNARPLGDAKFVGLPAGRGSSTVGYSDGMIKYPKKASDDPNVFHGWIDEVTIFGTAIAPEIVNALN